MYYVWYVYSIVGALNYEINFTASNTKNKLPVDKLIITTLNVHFFYIVFQILISNELINVSPLQISGFFTINIKKLKQSVHFLLVTINRYEQATFPCN